MKQLIRDREQFEKFTRTVLSPLQPGEVYFLSTSARKKKLTEEEREHYGLGRTEMMMRTLVRHDDNWDFAMQKMGSEFSYRRTKTGLEYPDKTLVCYVNINPSSMVEASMNFAKNVMNVMSEMNNAFMNGKTPNLKQLDKGDRLLLDYIQKSRSRRVFLDVDCDVQDDSVLFALRDAFSEYNVEHHVIKTTGGYHVLVNRESLSGTKCPLHQVVKGYNSVAQKSGGEVVFNSNAMVPLPGTLQYGNLVTML